MNCKQQCFGCHGFYGDGDIASEKRSSYHALTRNPNVDKSDQSTTNMVNYTRHFFVGSVLSVAYLNIQASMVE